MGVAAQRLPAAAVPTPAALARAVGNRSFSRMVRDGRVLARSRVLARQHDDAGAIEEWSTNQGEEWGLLDDTRQAVDAAGDGATVTLGGTRPIDVVISDGVRDNVRTAVRHRLMEILDAWLRPLRATLNDDHVISSRLDDQNRIRLQLGPLFRAISAGRADQRFEYPAGAPNGPAIINSALFMAELMGEGGAEDALANLEHDPDAAHRAAAHAAHLGTGDEWCGAFAFLELSGGGLSLPSSLTGNPLTGTGPPVAGNLDGFFLYMPALEVQVGDEWKPVATYHAERGSQRRLQVLPASGSEFDADTRSYEHHPPPRWGQLTSLDQLDARPGDIALIDNAKGTYADHITLVRSYDASTHTLHTIGGNEGAAHPVHASGAWHLDDNPAPQRNAPGAFKGESSRLYAIAGFSLVDFEVHTYRRPPRR